MYEGHFEPIWGHFGSFLVSPVYPNGPINRKYTFFVRILVFQEGTGTRDPASGEASRTVRGSFSGDFGSSLGSVWVSVGDFVSLDGQFAMNVESLWLC